MDFIPLEKNSCYKDCAAVTEELGFYLVELQVIPQKDSVKVSAVIASKDPAKDIGVSDCSKVHRALLAKVILLLNKSEDDIYMEVGSPGLERNIKNAAEFAFFAGRQVRLWDKNVTDWVSGVINGSTSENVTLEMEDGSLKTLSYNDIAKAKFIHL